MLRDPFILDKMLEYAKSENVPIIEEAGKECLIDLINKENIKNILEVGTAIGYSAIVMANINETIKVDTIERDFNRYTKAMDNVHDSGIDRINLIYGDALEIENDWLKEDYDLIFIDGAKAQSQKFVEKYEPLLQSGGYIFIDNIDFHGFATGEAITNNRNTRQLVGKINRFKEWFLNNDNYDVTYLHIGDGILIGKRK